MLDNHGFDEFMKELQDHPVEHAPYLPAALTIVLNAANGVRLWFRDHGVPLASAELIQMTRLVLDKKEDMHRRKREFGSV